MKIGSLFSGGIDGMSKGFQMASDDFQLTISNEIDDKAVEALKLNYSHKTIHDDIRNVSINHFMGLDGILGTFPCNIYTRAANIHKKGQKENFSQALHWAITQDLFLYFFRAVALCQPEFYLWENSPDIRKCPIVMETFKKIPNYHYQDIIIDTLDFRLPQKRKRLFVLGTKKPFTLPDLTQYQIFKKQLFIKDIKVEDPHIAIPDYIKSRIDGKYRDFPSFKYDGDIANTCVAHYAKDRSTTMIYDPRGYKNFRPFVNREYARIMGIGDNYKLTNSATANFQIIGNSVSPVVTCALGKALADHYFKKTIRSDYTVEYSYLNNSFFM